MQWETNTSKNLPNPMYKEKKNQFSLIHKLATRCRIVFKTVFVDIRKYLLCEHILGVGIASLFGARLDTNVLPLLLQV